MPKDNQIVAFIVFVPFLGKDGYMADVTRHGNGAPGGVMETIIYEAFQVFSNGGDSLRQPWRCSARRTG